MARKEFQNKQEQHQERKKLEQSGEAVSEHGARIASDAASTRQVYDARRDTPTAEEASQAEALREQIRQRVLEVHNEAEQQATAAAQELQEFGDDSAVKEDNQSQNAVEYAKLGKLNNQYDQQAATSLVRDAVASSGTQKDHKISAWQARKEVDRIKEMVKSRVHQELG